MVFTDDLIHLFVQGQAEQERRMQSGNKRYKCCTLLSRVYTTHTWSKRERERTKGTLLTYSCKRRSGQSEIDHISLKREKKSGIHFQRARS